MVKKKKKKSSQISVVEGQIATLFLSFPMGSVPAFLLLFQMQMSKHPFVCVRTVKSLLSLLLFTPVVPTFLRFIQYLI